MTKSIVNDHDLCTFLNKKAALRAGCHVYQSAILLLQLELNCYVLNYVSRM